MGLRVFAINLDILTFLSLVGPGKSNFEIAFNRGKDMFFLHVIFLPRSKSRKRRYLALFAFHCGLEILGIHFGKYMRFRV